MTLKELQTQVYEAVCIGSSLVTLAFVRNTKGLSSDMRLHTYKRSSFLKTYSSLENDYSITQLFLNVPDFEAFARQYFLEHPPDTHYINEISRHFPQYIQANKPASAPEFIDDIAKLEWLMIESFYNFYNYKKTRMLKEQTTSTIIPNPSVLFMESSWPIDKIWNEEKAFPQSQNTACIWTTQDRSVHVQCWSKSETQVLQTLLNHSNLESAVDELAPLLETSLLTKIFSQQLPEWIRLGIIHTVQTK